MQRSSYLSRFIFDLCRLTRDDQQIWQQSISTTIIAVSCSLRRYRYLLPQPLSSKSMVLNVCIARTCNSHSWTAAVRCNHFSLDLPPWPFRQMVKRFFDNCARSNPLQGGERTLLCTAVGALFLHPYSVRTTYDCHYAKTAAGFCAAVARWYGASWRQ